jgi:hypothetical protein
LRWGSVSGREEAHGRRGHDQDRLSDRELPRACLPFRRRCPPRPCATYPACLRTRRRAAVTPRPDALYADRGYDHDKYRKRVARLGSSRPSPVAASNLIPGWACTAGSLSRVSPYCTGSAGSASDGKFATTSTQPSSASLAPSPAGDASTTSQTVRSSEDSTRRPAPGAPAPSVRSSPRRSGRAPAAHG